MREHRSRVYAAKAPCRLIQTITLLAGVLECISFQHPCLTASAGFGAEPQLKTGGFCNHLYADYHRR
jgi:hypothetical protein